MVLGLANILWEGLALPSLRTLIWGKAIAPILHLAAIIEGLYRYRCPREVHRQVERRNQDGGLGKRKSRMLRAHISTE